MVLFVGSDKSVEKEEKMNLATDFEVLEQCLAALDHQFESLTQQAKCLAEQFLQGGVRQKKFLPILITVIEDKRCRSTVIRWSRTIPTGRNSENRVGLKAIAKGRNTHRYPDHVFRFLEPEVRLRVLLYEERLEVLRFALSKNRSASAHIRNFKTGLEKRLSL